MKIIPFYKSLLIPILLIISIFSLGWTCHNTNVPIVVPQDNCPYYDIDCDGISNAVEQNNANSYLGLDNQIPNSNPSIARGMPNNGWIDSAFNLPNTGSGYWHNLGTDPMDSDDWGVLHMVNMIEVAGREWFAGNLTPPRIVINDISKGDAFIQLFGGSFTPDHDSHQNGLDVDVRYIRKDKQELSLNIVSHPQDYDTAATSTMINRFILNADIDMIMISPSHGMLLESNPSFNVFLDNSGEHDNHIHLRIEDPDGTSN